MSNQTSSNQIFSFAKNVGLEDIPIYTISIILDYTKFVESERMLNVLKEIKKYEVDDLNMLYELKIKKARKTIYRFLKKVIFLKKSCSGEKWEEYFGNTLQEDPYYQYPYLSKRLLLLSYFFYYGKKSRRDWYFQLDVPWKLNILKEYNRKITFPYSYISSYDLYLLQRQMSYEEITIIGW